MSKRRIPSRLRAFALGDTLRYLRRMGGLTARQVATGLGLKEDFYRDLERGRLKRNDSRRRAILVELAERL